MALRMASAMGTAMRIATPLVPLFTSPLVPLFPCPRLGNLSLKSHLNLFLLSLTHQIQNRYLSNARGSQRLDLG